ncbi:hypothetical protein SKAU_G00290250 [Synaphobranchus kaupii]|uniref:Uncharacterized protein n=1 Tax=Synaphobranchus kaupii TaxID=118154 RepID=A0A9Q1IL94_SYNKA|nr:hypothetical protein SKAU_G00290250 [Synaphobranchus kaupii]
MAAGRAGLLWRPVAEIGPPTKNGGDDCIALETGNGDCTALEAVDGDCIAQEASDGIALKAGDGDCIALEGSDGDCIALDAGDGCVVLGTGGGDDCCLALKAGDGKVPSVPSLCGSMACLPSCKSLASQSSQYLVNIRKESSSAPSPS